jgi:excinuclease UvrABC helicase subunit UvrB
MTNSTIIAALNVTVDPELDKIIMDMADLENGFRSYEKAVVYAASRCTYEEAMTLRDAYAKLAETMQDVASATAVTFPI